MKQDKAVYAYATWSVGVIFGLMAACAGGNTPTRSEELENQIAVMYAGAEPIGAAAAGGGSGLGGSGGGGGSVAMGMGGGGTGGASSCDGFGILKMNCGNGPCHDQQVSSPGALSNFVLDPATAAAFVDEPSDQCASTDNSPIFDPESPAQSLVIKKITAMTACGARMPIGATTQALTAAELTCVQTWIGTL